MTRYLYRGVFLIFIAVAIASGTAACDSILHSPLSTLHFPLSTLYCLLPLALVALAGALGLWYLWRSLQLRLREREVAIERAWTEFTPTERGFAPRLIDGRVVNPNVVPSAVTPLEAERPEEVPEERRLAGVLGWHLSNAPARRTDWAIRPTALPIPEPEPSPWEVSHVERLLLEAEGET